MLNPLDLSQSRQPKAYYDYDGLSGGWLRFPWWVHLLVAVLAWPLCWWIFPLLPFQNVKITYFLEQYKIQLASSISILTVMTSCFSYIKARRIRERQQRQPKTNVKEGTHTKVKVRKVANKTEVASEAKKTVERKPKKTRKSAEKVESKKNISVSRKVNEVAPKKKRVVKKKNDQQVSLNFDE